jgi:hypothetical protein
LRPIATTRRLEVVIEYFKSLFGDPDERREQ